MRFSFYKYILVFFFIVSCTTIDELHGIDNLKIKSESLQACTTIDELHGIDNLKIKSESLQANITNSNDVLNLIGPL